MFYLLVVAPFQSKEIVICTCISSLMYQIKNVHAHYHGWFSFQLRTRKRRHMLPAYVAQTKTLTLRMRLSKSFHRKLGSSFHKSSFWVANTNTRLQRKLLRTGELDLCDPVKDWSCSHLRWQYTCIACLFPYPLLYMNCCDTVKHQTFIHPQWW